MPGCPYFVANTFAHLLGGLMVTGISTENPLVGDIGKKPMTHLAIVLAVFVNLFAVIATEPGPLKYALYIALTAIVGQMLSGFANRLKQQKNLSETLFTSGLIFFTMAAVGVIDNQNLLGWGVYLSAALGVLMVATIYNLATTESDRQRSDWRTWLARFGVGLFAVYVAFDVEILKANAARCNGDPDYVGESMNLFFDMLNLFTQVGSSD
jgi:FtsH-binding integral membrane protein